MPKEPSMRKEKRWVLQWETKILKITREFLEILVDRITVLFIF